jgi:hypothetical protein
MRQDLEINILNTLKILITYVKCVHPRCSSSLPLNKMREEVEEEVRSYWMTLGKQVDVGNWNKEALDPTLWRTGLGRAMELLKDRIRDDI